MMPTSENKKEYKFLLHKAICPSPEVNEVFLGGHRIDEDYRIVLVDLGLEQAFMINLDTVARFPICVSLKELIKSIDSEEVFIADIEMHPKLRLAEEYLTDSFKERSNVRMSHIQALVDDLESVIRNGYGDGVFKRVIEQSGKSRQYIYDTFYSYLKHGARKYCLGLPQGKNAVHTPKDRNIKVKQGRPNSKVAKGKVIEEKDIEAFVYGKRFYEKNNQPSLDKVMREVWRKYYFESRMKLSTNEAMITGQNYKVKLLPPDKRPTRDQFHYWLTKQYGGSLPKRNAATHSNTEYQASLAGRAGDSFKHIIAPGELYQLDETPFDEEVVSIFDPTRTTKLGKATVYFVRDTFSRAVAGIYITTQNPSYATAKEAIYNAAREKLGFLKEINCPVEADLWKISGVPQALLVDRAEFHNTLSEGAITDLPVVIKLTRAGRGDDKGLIESIFHVYRSFFKGLSKSLQTKSLHEIAKQTARKNACLTISELYIVMTIYAVYFNNNKVLSNYPLTREMIQDGVKPIPSSIFKWGMKYRPGCLLDASEEELYLRLIEKGEVSVHRTHVYLKGAGLHYNCSWTLETGHQDRRGSRNRAPLFPCRYFRGLVDTILICTPEGVRP